MNTISINFRQRLGAAEPVSGPSERSSVMRGCRLSRSRKSGRRFGVRRGITLIEMSATLGVLMLLSVSAIGMLNAVTGIGKTDAAAKSDNAATVRLSTDLRNHVRGASDAHVGEDGHELKFNMYSGEVVTYRIVQSELSTTIRRTTATDEGKTASVEEYSIGPELKPLFSVDEQLVSMSLAKHPLPTRIQGMLSTLTPADDASPKDGDKE